MHGQSWHKAALIGLLTGVILLLILMTLTSSAVFRTYQNDVASNAEECVAEAAAEDYKKSRECQGILYRTLDDPVALLTSILDLATLALFFATYLLFVAAVRQGGDAKEALDAARASASAALASVNLAEKAFEGGETPYLDISASINLSPNQYFSGEVGEKAISTEIATYILTNFGRSPANVLEIYQGSVIDSICPTEMGFPPLQTNLRRQVSIGPGKVSNVNAVCIYKDEISQFQDWVAGRILRNATLWLVVQIRYRDVFNNQFLTGSNLAYNSVTGSFYALGGPQHNYRRKLTPDELIIAEKRDAYPVGRA